MVLKKNYWLTCVKCFFIPKPKHYDEKERSKMWKWLMQRLKLRQHHPSLDLAHEKTLDQATEEQRKHILAVAAATVAAAEAAVAAANAAAEVVRLTKEPYELHMRIQFVAIVKIQSAYRGHLARKALSALRGLVKLQAVVRGELVRRRIFKTLPKTELVQRTRSVPSHSTLLDCFNQGERKHGICRKDGTNSEEGIQLHCSSQRNWDPSLVSMEDTEALCVRKQEALARRERMKQYSFSHRERRNDHNFLQESMSYRENRNSSRFDQHVELQEIRSSETKKLRHLSRSNTMAGLKMRAQDRQEHIGELKNSTFSQPRRSFSDVKDDTDYRYLTSSPVFPMYMAATESAKAKTRSLSTPRQRLRFSETYPDEISPFRVRLFT